MATKLSARAFFREQGRKGGRRAAKGMTAEQRIERARKGGQKFAANLQSQRKAR